MSHQGSGLRRDDLRTDNGLGLLAQGGGVRGAFTMGALSYLAEVGLYEAFDVCIGASSGALSLAYFISGQAASVDESYWEALSKSVNPWRFWNIFDVNGTVNNIIFGSHSLDIETLRNNPSRFLVGVLDAKLRLPCYVVAQELGDQELKDILRATCALPGLQMSKASVNGKHYIDGGFVDTLPLFRLKMLGCDRIVVITTSPLGYSITNDSWLRRSIIKLLAAKHNRLVRQWIGAPNPLHDENLEALLYWAENPEKSGVLSIHPPSQLGELTIKPDEMNDMFLVGKTAAEKALQSISWLDEHLTTKPNSRLRRM